MQHVGVRELRGNLAAFLERASHGEEFLVTERGRPVARLVPVDEQELILQRLAAEGRLRRARHRRSPLAPPIKVRGNALSDALRELKGP